MGWFERRSGNKRLRQRNVLEVKVSVAQMRRQRFRLLFYATAASLAVLFALYVCWRAGESLLNRLVYENDNYTVRVLDIQTDGVMSVEQIRRWAGVKQGDNLFALDLARIKRDLELVPGIQGVAVERILPHTLRMHIQEREPVAQILTTVAGPQGVGQTVVCLLDAEGYVMLPLESWQRAVPAGPSEQYPVLSGLSPAQLSPGRRVESPQVRAALRLIAAFEHSPMAGLVELKRIDVASPEVLLILTDQESQITVCLADLERQLNRWRIIFDLGTQSGRQIDSLDLSVSDNIPLRWQESAPVPPGPPKIRKLSPYKKRHV